MPRTLFLLSILTLSVAIPASAGNLTNPSIKHEGRIIAIFNCKTGETIVDARKENRELTSDELKLAASGWCSLLQNPNGSNYCKSQSCTGSCKLHNLPARCTCD
jgi:hypothetical protein